MGKQTVSTTSDGFLLVTAIAAIVVAIAALVIALLAILKEEKVVYVDSMKLITNYKGSKSAKEAYDKKVAVWRANMDTLTKEFNDAVAKYEREKNELTAKEKTLTEELLANKRQQLVSYQQATTENASKEDKEVTAKVFKEVDDFIKRYGEKHGYDYIMGATSMGNIVYAKKINDITDEVLKQLNEEYRTK
jgi:outer membrane protein